MQLNSLTPTSPTPHPVSVHHLIHVFGTIAQCTQQKSNMFPDLQSMNESFNSTKKLNKLYSLGLLAIGHRYRTHQVKLHCLQSP